MNKILSLTFIFSALISPSLYCAGDPYVSGSQEISHARVVPHTLAAIASNPIVAIGIAITALIKFESAFGVDESNVGLHSRSLPEDFELPRYQSQFGLQEIPADLKLPVLTPETGVQPLN